MSRNWLSDALLCILMPACLFDTDSLCHPHKRISERVGIRSLVQPQLITLSVCFCPVYQSSAVKVSRSRLPSQRITVLSHYPAAPSGGAAAVLNFETDRPSVGCQIVSCKWPAYSPSLSTRCRRLPWQTHQWESKSDRRMKGDTRRQRAGWNGFTNIVKIP